LSELVKNKLSNMISIKKKGGGKVRVHG